MSDTPEFMTHERIMTGEEYVSYSDYLSLQRERDEAREESAKLRDISDGCLIALERATKYLPEYSRVNYEDALWRLRKKLEEETK